MPRVLFACSDNSTETQTDRAGSGTCMQPGPYWMLLVERQTVPREGELLVFTLEDLQDGSAAEADPVMHTVGAQGVDCWISLTPPFGSGQLSILDVEWLKRSGFKLVSEDELFAIFQFNSAPADTS